MGGSGGTAPKPPKCGDGKVDPGESCDDGNTMDGDSCLGTCLNAAIGMATGVVSTCAIVADGRVKCWGKEKYGSLGLGILVDALGDEPGEMGDKLPYVDLGAGEIAIAINSSRLHTCAILKSDKLKCWGSNEYGALGLGELGHRGDAPGEMGDNLPAVDLGAGQIPIAVEPGTYHTCALLLGGSVKCWGTGYSLGLGDTTDRGLEPNQMGDNLPAVDLGTGKTAVAISGGANHTCALLNDGSVKCWGNNNKGDLGLGDKEWRGEEPNEMGDNLPPVELPPGSTVVAITSGSKHNCALLLDGNVVCWGYNVFGQLGLGDTLDRGDEPGEMGASLPTVDLGSGKTAVAVFAGNDNTCALLNDGNVKCWGRNWSGALGLGDMNHRGDDLGEMGDFLPPVDLGSGLAASALTLSHSSICALFKDGHIKCWGINDEGNLGLGDTEARGDSPGEMGDNLPFVKL
jgi:cysteine-rich repeat protein